MGDGSLLQSPYWPKYYPASHNHRHPICQNPLGSGLQSADFLGTCLFEAGESGYVELSDAADGKVLADAVLFSLENY